MFLNGFAPTGAKKHFHPVPVAKELLAFTRHFGGRSFRETELHSRGNGMGKRAYRLKKRAETRDETRERILQATMLLHDEKGVATTSFTDVAARAGVGAATVYRNFPTLESLVQACGAHVLAGRCARRCHRRRRRLFESLSTTP